MNAKEFNAKYKDYLEEGHYGLDVHDTDFIKWLDKQFENYIKIPGFSYSQIKTKFGMGRFYCAGLSREEVLKVELKINEFIEQKNKSTDTIKR